MLGIENKYSVNTPVSGHLEKKMPKITVIVPALNEEKNLPHLLPKMPPIVDEVLLVNGLSTDRTLEVAIKHRPDIRIIHQDGKGKGNAIRNGVRYATGDIVVMIDADISMNPGEIPSFIEPLIAGYDLAKGSRFISNGGTADMNLFRRFGNSCFLFLVNLLFGGKYTDLCYGYAAFWRESFHAMDITSDGFEIETEMNIKSLQRGLRVKEVPSYEEARLSGKTNLRAFRDGMRIIKTILKLRFSKTSHSSRKSPRSQN